MSSLSLWTALASVCFIASILGEVQLRGKNFGRSILYAWAWSNMALVLVFVFNSVVWTFEQHEEHWSLPASIPDVVTRTLSAWTGSFFFIQPFFLFTCVCTQVCTHFVTIVGEKLLRVLGMNLTGPISTTTARILQGLLMTALSLWSIFGIRDAFPRPMSDPERKEWMLKRDLQNLNYYRLRDCEQNNSPFWTAKQEHVERIRGSCNIDRSYRQELKTKFDWKQAVDHPDQLESELFNATFRTNRLYRFGRCLLTEKVDGSGTLEFDFTSRPSNQKERFFLLQLEVEDIK